MEEQEIRELFFERLEMRAFQEAYPNPPSIQPRRVVGSARQASAAARRLSEADGRIGARWS